MFLVCALLSVHSLKYRKLSRSTNTRGSRLPFELYSTIPTLDSNRRLHTPSMALFLNKRRLISDGLGTDEEHERVYNRTFLMKRGLYTMMDQLLSIQRSRGGPD
jgi:hypothetical protein